MVNRFILAKVEWQAWSVCSGDKSIIMSRQHFEDIKHSKAANDPEHRILNSITQHHSHSEIIRELQQLKEADHKSGRDFKQDLKLLTEQLNKDLEKLHLPPVTITDNGKSFDIKTADNRFHQLPAPVRHAIRANAHRHFRHGEGSFVPPSKGAPDRGGPDDQSAPGPDGKPINPTESSPSKTGFAEKLLNRLGLPVTEKNMQFFDAWQKAEGGSADNPFNTTQNAPGATRFNSVGVRRYPSIDVGVEATAKTLTNGHYGGILEALKKGDNAHQAAVAVSKTPWGTGNGVSRLV